jgi:hypothetical protein
MYLDNPCAFHLKSNERHCILEQDGMKHYKDVLHFDCLCILSEPPLLFSILHGVGFVWFVHVLYHSACFSLF